MNLIKSIKLTILMIALISIGVMAQPGDNTNRRYQDTYLTMISLHKSRPMIAEGYIYHHIPDVEVESWMLDEDYLSSEVVPVELWMLDEKYLDEKVPVESWMLDTKYLE